MLLVKSSTLVNILKVSVIFIFDMLYIEQRLMRESFEEIMKFTSFLKQQNNQNILEIVTELANFCLSSFSLVNVLLKRAYRNASIKRPLLLNAPSNRHPLFRGFFNKRPPKNSKKFNKRPVSS